MSSPQQVSKNGIALNIGGAGATSVSLYVYACNIHLHCYNGSFLSTVVMAFLLLLSGGLGALAELDSFSLVVIGKWVETFVAFLGSASGIIWHLAH